MSGGRWAAPGRVNLIGEHTDYNDGFVLPLALPQRTVVHAARASDGAPTVVSSAQAPDDEVSFRTAELKPGRLTGWGSYVAGVAWALREAGHAIGDLTVSVDSDVPLGAGLSSSAALECAVALAWTELSDLHIDRSELARLCRRAENEFVGAPTGIMDQMASLYGRAGHLVFLDTRSLVVEQVPLDLAAAGLVLLVVDTRAPHRLVDGEYAERRRSCDAAVAALGVPALRDARLDDLAGLPDLLRRRARHVVTENARVLAVVETLRSGADPREIGPLLTESHVSLRDDFEVTVPEVDVAVDALLAAGAHGARITGGGFGGCVIALVDADHAGTAVAAVEKEYARHGFSPPATFTAEPAAGAHRIDP